MNFLPRNRAVFRRCRYLDPSFGTSEINEILSVLFLSEFSTILFYEQMILILNENWEWDRP